MKKIIRLTESDLHRIIKNSVNRILREENVLNNYEAFTIGEKQSDPTNYDPNSFNGEDEIPQDGNEGETISWER